MNNKSSIIDLSNKLKRHQTKKYPSRQLSKIARIVIHCTDRNWTIDQLVDFDVEGSLTYTREDGQTITDINHISNSGIPGITYHELIMPDGQAYYTLPYTESSYHAAGYNSTSIAIALMLRVTDIKTNKDTYGPSFGMLTSLYERCAELCMKFKIAPDQIVGHRELEGTGYKIVDGKKRLMKTCPGLKTDLDKVRHQTGLLIQKALADKNLYTGKIDGVFGVKSKAALNKL